MDIKDYEGLADYQEVNRKKKRKMIIGAIGLGLFSLSLTSTITTSLMMLSVATTSPAIGIISLLAGIIFTTYFYKSFVIGNPVLKKAFKTAVSLLPKTLSKMIKGKKYCMELVITKENSLGNVKKPILLVGKKSVLECISKRLFEYSQKGYIQKGDYSIRIKKQPCEINIKDNKSLYLQMFSKGVEVRKIEASVFSSGDGLDKLTIFSKQKGSIGFFIDSMKNNGMRIEANEDKLKDLRKNIFSEFSNNNQLEKFISNELASDAVYKQKNKINTDEKILNNTQKPFSRTKEKPKGNKTIYNNKFNQRNESKRNIYDKSAYEKVRKNIEEVRQKRLANNLNDDLMGKSSKKTMDFTL